MDYNYVERVESQSELRDVCMPICGISISWCLVCINVLVR